MERLRAMVHRIKLTAEIMCACANFARSHASQIGDQLDKINSVTFSSLTIMCGVTCSAVLTKKMFPLENGPST